MLLRQDPLQPDFTCCLQHPVNRLRRDAATFIEHPIHGCQSHTCPSGDLFQRHADLL